MRIQLDTTVKTIKIEEQVNLGEFIDMIKNLLPGELWREFKIETNVVIYWSNPIVIDRWVQPYTPTYYPWITDTTSGTALNNGVYNIQL